MFSQILNWKSKVQSLTALMSYILVVWFFQLWMVPGAMVLLILRRTIGIILTGGVRGGKLEQVETIIVEENRASTLAQMQDIVLKIQVSKMSCTLVMLIS